MGRLDFPPGSVVYVDSSAIIYSVEQIEPFAQLLVPLWKAADNASQVEITSALSVTECLVKPKQTRDVLLENVFREFLMVAGKLRLIPISLGVLEEAANVRAQTRLKAPDAIHAATALLARVSAFVTNDVDFQRVPGLQTIVLSQLPESNA